MRDDESGYTDTPRIPGSAYHVHDPGRPKPPRVDPGETATENAGTRRPSDAKVLIDGDDLRHWESVDGEDADWVVKDDYVEVRPGTGDIRTEDRFGDCHLHVEWAAPPDVDGTGQGRGNSGVFLMERYEIQVLDCYENATYSDGYAAAVYGQYPPLANACREPGAWQTYDII